MAAIKTMRVTIEMQRITRKRCLFGILLKRAFGDAMRAGTVMEKAKAVIITRLSWSFAAAGAGNFDLDPPGHPARNDGGAWEFGFDKGLDAVHSRSSRHAPVVQAEVVRRALRPFARPTALDEAASLLAEQPWCVLAGGTDLYPAHVDKPLTGPVMDISGIAPLRSVVSDEAGWRLGALASWSDLLRADLPPSFDGLKLAAKEIGSIQIQNAGTIGGNLCNASPAADSVPPLLTLDASVELTSAKGKRCLPLAAFITGYRATARRKDELLTAVLIPKQAGRGVGGFEKLGARRYLVISIVMAALRLQATAGRVTAARIALGACSPVATRLPVLEEALIGKDLATLGRLVRPAHLRTLSPIDDVRATSVYRKQAALALIQRMLNQAAETWQNDGE